MPTETQGIHQLIVAERRAGEKIAEAKKRRIHRLKQAKKEAQEEIETFRAERERQLKNFEEKRLGSREHVAAKISGETDVKLEELNRIVAANKPHLVNDLVDLVCNSQIKLHRNYAYLAHPNTTT